MTSTFSHDSSSWQWTAFVHRAAWNSLRTWITSGCLPECLLLATGPAQYWSVPRHVLLVGLNVLYLAASTSWLFHGIFAFLCWMLVVATCITQYTTASRFTRGRLRATLKRLHVYRDRVAFFELPALLIDVGVKGFATIGGATIRLMDLSVNLHGIEIDLDLGSNHRLSIYSDAITIRLFRKIVIGETYCVHRPNSELDDTMPGRYEPSTKISSRAEEPVKQGPTNRPTPSKLGAGGGLSAAQRPARADLEAEEGYDRVLLALDRSSCIQQSRDRVTRLHTAGQPIESSEFRAAVCADLGETHRLTSFPNGFVATSKIISMFRLITTLVRHLPIILRATLCLLSQCHQVDCPAICLSSNGEYLGDVITDKLYRHHVTEDNRIAQLKHECAQWLAASDMIIEFTDLQGHASVPLRTSNDTRAALRSKNVTVTRFIPDSSEQDIQAETKDPPEIATLSGADVEAVIPTCLLPFHIHLFTRQNDSSEQSSDIDQADTVPISLAIRATLPAKFSDALLDFAATLWKTSQMLDIEEEDGLCESKTNDQAKSNNDDERSDTDINSGAEEDDMLHKMRSKLKHSRLGAAVKHPLQRTKQKLHKEVKKTAVDRVDGAWFAKWTNKLLKQLEWLDGDVGYSMKIPVSTGS